MDRVVLGICFMTEYLGKATSLWCPELAPVALLSDAAGPGRWEGQQRKHTVRCSSTQKELWTVP